MTMERWDDLNAWALQAGVRIVFGLNSLSENMTEAYHGKSAVIAGEPWDPSNVKALLEYTKRKRYFEKGSIYGFGADLPLAVYLILLPFHLAESIDIAT